MDQQLYQKFLNEHVITLKAKLDDFLPVVLGARRAAQIIIPAELPDAAILGATIDDRFRQKMAGERLPGESLTDFLKSRVAGFRKRSKIRDIRFRLQVLRDIYSNVVENSNSYKLYVDWADKLGLIQKQLESRPTIRELYVFTDNSIANELEKLQDLRKDIRYEFAKRPDPSIPGALRAFPEEHTASFLTKSGKILGYPVCCIDRYVFDRQSGVLSPEVRASNQIKHAESASEINRFAYFTKDFFPCQPDCKEAVKLGEKIYNAFKRLDPELADNYLKHLDGNKALVKQYPELIQKRMASLKQETSSEGTDPFEG